ncbi:MAG: hypothetical protein IH790_04265 [Acidobacteria bacterium]|nr:hypothetical protein [Acidobacteriota bacterium]
MPLWEDHRDFMRSRHADLWNSGPKRDGHPIQGAAFLSFFVDDEGNVWVADGPTGARAEAGAADKETPPCFSKRSLVEQLDAPPDSSKLAQTRVRCVPSSTRRASPDRPGAGGPASKVVSPASISLFS